MSQELTKDDKIKTFLLFYGITEDVHIVEEEQDIVLMALSHDDVDKVYVENGDLIIEHRGTDE